MTRLGRLSLAFLCVATIVGRASAACTLDKIAELPVTMLGLEPTISAKVNGGEARFVADSGAFYSLITPSGAAEFKLKTFAPWYGIEMQGVGGKARMTIATVKEFTLAGVPLHDIQFMVGGTEEGSETIGLLGQNVLGIADVEYDLADGVIRLFRPKDCERAMLAYWDKDSPFSQIDILPATPLSPHTRGDVYLDGIKLRALFDTGAAVSTLTTAGARLAGIDLKGSHLTVAGSSVGIGRREAKTWITTVDRFKIGDEEIRHAQLRITEISSFDTDMLIGADFFLSHRVYVAKSQKKLYFTYNGGPVFNLGTSSAMAPAPAKAKAGVEPAAAVGAAAPIDAGSLARRAAAEAARQDFTEALADFDRAHALAPLDARLLYQRAMTHWRAGHDALAKADFDAALALQPDDAPALLARAQFAAAHDHARDATADIDHAAAVLDPGDEARIDLAALYMDAENYAAAIPQLDLWLKVHPADARRAKALNRRCWARAMLGRDLPMALADCNSAMRLSSGSALPLDSRGFVHLQLGEFDLAIADFDAALAKDPRIAWSLYGRGVARTRKGLSADGARDIAAAVALDAKLPDKAKRAGIAP